MTAFTSCAGDLAMLRTVLLGYRNAGKWSSGNTILGEEVFHAERNSQSVKNYGEVAGSLVTVVKAPSWEMGKPVEDVCIYVLQDLMRFFLSYQQQFLSQRSTEVCKKDI